MAGDWIKFDKATLEKPEVAMIADELGIDDDAVVGKLLRIWAWADEHCHADGVTSVTLMSRLDRRVAVTGFCQAMVNAGWLVIEDEQLQFPNFGRHNGNPAKSRALATERKRESRSKRDKCHGQSVTKTRPEKRREEKSIDSHNRARRSPKDLKECIDYAAMISVTEDDARGFYDSQESGGWTRGGQPLKDWRASMRTWKRNGWLPSQKKAKGYNNNQQADRMSDGYDSKEAI